MSPHGVLGPACPLYWGQVAANVLTPKGPIVEGTDGSSRESALRVHVVPKEALSGAEKGWVYEHFWMPIAPKGSLGKHPFHEFEKAVTCKTERISKRVYDIVTLTLPSGETRITYFDVTNYRYFWPKDK